MSERTRSRSVAGRVAVVTGAASGMGRATAALLGAEGARVSCWDVHDGVAEVAEGITAGGGEAVAVTVDISDEGAVASAVATTRRALGPIDLLVNNAGISLPAPLDGDGWREAWDRTLAVDLTGPALVLRACLDDLRRDGEGRVVNIASTEGLGATAFLSPYTAAKHGVIGLTRAAAVELAPAGVTVNCVCPGPIRTGMTAVIPDEHKERFARRRVPMRRYGEPEEVADVIVSLLLPSASYATGAVVTVDGGLTVQNT
ncbi:SDR family NAD(P)-dependent oxidoreductase [Dermatobacter hominis]|uniref:SDR family NAD(P)-dependent oxidoreductase n=1 Tax=Dermatobacter hominis TaxID=2884263 RepID=UPI001D11EED6|nr:SDR family NAD(P)-dependent oxidoreductase [Dermatobacter hominis]UDY36479.1 SDR family oxidoreductase [Dermatobacter hominis]